MFDKSSEKKGEEQEQKDRVQEMKRVLLNAIKMHALYSDGKIKIVETSNLVH